MVNSLTRLYIGNLSPQVDEYALIQLCSKYGKISSLSYLFHKTGPMKGKPRGYAFVEYSTKEEATRAKLSLHDKLIRGRKMVVTFAQEQEHDPSAPASSGQHGHGQGMSGKPTAISLMKGPGVVGGTTINKIAALEAKLAAMDRNKPLHSPSPSGSTPTPPHASTSNFTSHSGAPATFSLTTPSETFLDSIDLSIVVGSDLKGKGKRGRDGEGPVAREGEETLAAGVSVEGTALGGGPLGTVAIGGDGLDKSGTEDEVEGPEKKIRRTAEMLRRAKEAGLPNRPNFASPMVVDSGSSGSISGR